MKQTSIYKVKSMILGKTNATFYTVDGGTVTVKQGDPRLALIIQQVQPYFARQQAVEIDFSEGRVDVYKDFSEQTNGVVKLFRVMKKAVSSWFKEPKEVKHEAGHVTYEYEPLAPIEDVLKEAVEHSSDSTPITEEETVVAVVGNKILPEAERLETLMSHAIKTGHSAAMAALMARLADMKDERNHSVKDVLKFLEKSDLPVTINGDIIAYKILRSKGDDFVDCHSGQVLQNVGYIVCVKDEIINMSRHNECAAGLHIARRGYLGSFSGSHVFLCKIRPEDIMVVPHGDPNKVRVRAYEILDVFSEEAFEILKRNKPITHLEFEQAKLTKALAGAYPPAHTRVTIGGDNGSNLTVEKIKNQPEAKDFEDAVHEVGKAALAVDDERAELNKVAPLNINEVRDNYETELAKVSEEKKKTIKPVSSKTDPRKAKKAARKAKAKPAPKATPTKAVPPQKKAEKPVATESQKPLTGKDAYLKMFDLWTNGLSEAFDQLVTAKKKSKKSWAALGFKPEQISVIEAELAKRK